LVAAAHCTRRVGRTFQNVQLFQNLNALENVIAARFCRTDSSLLEALLFLPKDRRDRQLSREVAEELLDWVGIAAERFLMPRELPYGEQRRPDRSFYCEGATTMVFCSVCAVVPQKCTHVMYRNLLVYMVTKC